MTLPTLDELPAAAGDSYSPDTLARLAIVPRDDIELRAMAIEEFMMDHKGGVTVPGPDLDAFNARAADLRFSIPGTPARTPGGIAWKLLEALEMVEAQEGDKWSRWRHLVNGACADAIELERSRQHD